MNEKEHRYLRAMVSKFTQVMTGPTTFFSSAQPGVATLDLAKSQEIQDGNAQIPGDFERFKMPMAGITGRRGHQGHPVVPHHSKVLYCTL